MNIVLNLNILNFLLSSPILSEIKKTAPCESNLIMIAIISNGSKIKDNNNPKKISTNRLNFFFLP